jgi:hypothetical protein
VADLAKAGDTIRTRVLDRGTTCSNAGKKAAATRRRNAANRSMAAKRGAWPRSSA